MRALDGVMLGRAAWHHPDVLAELDRRLVPDRPPVAPEQVLESFLAYAERQHALGVPLHILFRGILGWRTGRPGARRWRRLLSDPRALEAHGPGILRHAWAQGLDALPA
jgi:tRNA-dihydrouridine synthase A